MNHEEQAFLAALDRYAPRYGVQLEASASRRLCDYFSLVMSWNARLHLVAPCPPAEFAKRHVLESLCALPHLPDVARVVDVGSGAGLPVIPCLIARARLSATLIEASPKKTVFLREALRNLNLSAAARVSAERFEKTRAPPAEFVMCRALERFTEMLPELVDWSPPASTLLLFGGPSLREKLDALRLSFIAIRLPESEQRFLFVAQRETA